MIDYATSDASVRKMIVAEKMQSARADFEASGTVEITDVEQIDESWKERLDVDRKGNIYGTIDNIMFILENDPYFSGRIAFDDFEKCEVRPRSAMAQGISSEPQTHRP